MSSFTHQKFYELALTQCLGKKATIQRVSPVSGGCINNAVILETDIGEYFLKWQSSIPSDMFEKESAGLGLLAASGFINTPAVLGYGYEEGKFYLVLESIRSARRSKDYWEHFGMSLAQLHEHEASTQYGLDHHNYIGKLPQYNHYSQRWVDFFINQRLETQLLLAIENRLVSEVFIRKYRSFYDILPRILPEEKPSMLHGDLWSGNVMVGNDGHVCLIDPAVYYGHREIELAFTTMFGGFDDAFYESYQSTWPLEPGYSDRFEIYNIYPSMVHANLFGPSYLHGVEAILRKYA